MHVHTHVGTAALGLRSTHEQSLAECSSQTLSRTVNKICLSTRDGTQPDHWELSGQFREGYSPNSCCDRADLKSVPDRPSLGQHLPQAPCHKPSCTTAGDEENLGKRRINSGHGDTCSGPVPQEGGQQAAHGCPWLQFVPELSCLCWAAKHLQQNQFCLMCHLKNELLWSFVDHHKQQKGLAGGFVNEVD